MVLRQKNKKSPVKQFDNQKHIYVIFRLVSLSSMESKECQGKQTRGHLEIELAFVPSLAPPAVTIGVSQQQNSTPEQCNSMAEQRTS